MQTLLKKNLAVIFLFLLSILYVFFHINLLGDTVYWWTPDSASYIEAARNYSASGRLVVSSGLTSIDETKPIRLWPPGYPILLSFAQDITGVDSKWVAVLFSIISWIIVPSIIFILVRPLLSEFLSFLLSILVLTSPAAQEFGWKGLSDMPFLLIVLLGFVLSCKPGSGNKATLDIFIGGVLLGMSFSIRNTGAAALVAVFTCYCITYAVQHEQRREIFLKMIVWSLGATIIVLPVFIRNIKIFGTIQPYSMAPSTVSFLSNIREYIRVTIYDLFGFHEWATLIAWDFVFLTLIVGIALGISSYFFYQHSESTIKRVHNLLDEFKYISPNIYTLIPIVIYFILGGAIVIYARTKYEWGEIINLRHVMQYDWAILTVLFFILLRLIKEYYAKTIVYVMCTIILFGHLYYSSVELYWKEPKNDKLLLKYNIYKDNTLTEEVIKFSKQGVVVASNFHDVLRINSGVPIRHIYLKDEEQLTQSLQKDLLVFQKRIFKQNKEGHVYIFLEKNLCDRFMEEKLLFSKMIVKRQNESLVTVHISPS